MVTKKEVDKFVLMMIEVLSDPRSQKIYIIDPIYVMNQWGISKEVQTVILSGKSDEIHKMFVDAGFPIEGKVMINDWPK